MRGMEAADRRKTFSLPHNTRTHSPSVNVTVGPESPNIQFHWTFMISSVTRDGKKLFSPHADPHLSEQAYTYVS